MKCSSVSNVTFLNNEHPLNGFDPIVVTDDGIVIVSSEEYENAKVPIDSNDLGNDIQSKDEHLSNADSPIVSYPSSNVIVSSFSNA